MTLEEKIEVVKEFSEPSIKAIEKYLDCIYNLTDKYFDENMNLKEGLTPDAKLEKFLKELRTDAFKFEEVRHKLIKKDFQLSLVEINLIAAAFIYINEVWIKDIEKLKKASEETEIVIKKLTSPANEN